MTSVEKRKSCNNAQIWPRWKGLEVCLYRYDIVCINTNDSPGSSEKIVELEKLLIDKRADINEFVLL